MKKIFVCVVLMFAVNCMTLDNNLFNSKPLDHYELPGNTIPDSLIQPVSFASNGNTLYGYWVQGDSVADSGLTVLYCHGNKYNIDQYWDRVMYFHQWGVNVFIFDYRGYGMSTGESSEQGLHEDGQAALAYVKNLLHVPADSIVLYGYSLGNVVSIYLASLPTTNALCIFAEAPFASANSLTQGSTVLDIPPQWLTEGKFDNAENIKKISSPFYLFHGKKDDFVRYRDNGKIVYDNAPNPKGCTIVEEANHTDIPETMGIQVYLNTIKTWINKAKSGNF
jgi:fermentation-respiration switch protein FrsA (DUF1100 family)